MFNIVNKYQKTVKGIMIIIIGSFVAWGLGDYFGMASDDGYAAKVGNNKIYPNEINRVRDQNPQSNQDDTQILFGLINRQLVINFIEDSYMTISDKQLQNSIIAMPMFKDGDNFSKEKYHEFLRQNYFSAAKFERLVKDQDLLELIISFHNQTYFNSHLFQEKFAELLSKQRNVSRHVVSPKSFYEQIKISESDVNGYYKQNIAQFTLPAKVKLQYIELNPNLINESEAILAADIDKYIKDYPMANDEQVDVSHILFSVPENATQSQKQKIQTKAQETLLQLRKQPNKFAQFAKEFSADPGSAQKGGDLGFFARGVMVKPFESVAFSMKKNQISDLVETQFGYHILRLNAIKGAKDPQAERDYAIAQIKKQRTKQQLTKVVEQLNDITYTTANSLEPAAKKLHLELKTSPWVVQGESQGQFANVTLQKSAFSDDVINKRNNSEVIDLGDSHYIVLRAIDYQSSKPQPITEVYSKINAELKNLQANQLAIKSGESSLVILKNGGKVAFNFDSPEDVNLLGQSKDIDQMAIRQIFAVAGAKFPAYTGVVNQNGEYVIYRINNQYIDKALISQSQNMINQLNQQYSLMILNAYVSALRSSYPVNYNIDRVKNKTDSSIKVN